MIGVCCSKEVANAQALPDVQPLEMIQHKVTVCVSVAAHEFAAYLGVRRRWIPCVAEIARVTNVLVFPLPARART